MSSGQGHFTVEPNAPGSFDADASGATITSSCRPYSQPPDLYNSRDSTPSDAIHEIVERYFNGRRSDGNVGEMLRFGNVT